MTDRSDLLNLTPCHDTFVGIDSDGCVFDTMEVKQKQCFHGHIIYHWQLEPVEAALREVAEFVNLYSRFRGQNRFTALVMTMDLLRDHPAVSGTDISIPGLDSLRKFITSGAILGNASLEDEVNASGDPELASVLEWSLAVNDTVARIVQNLPPFTWARKSLDRIQDTSDAIVVSQTPCEALEREWEENNLTSLVRVIAGQELGTKTEHLHMATSGRYAGNKVIMIGDAFGDLAAARDNNVLFYPINPGREEASWERFCKESYDRFLTGDYAGSYEQKVIDEFKALLPETPPWK